MPSLLIAKLTVRSSYVLNSEQPADGRFDTIQFYLPDEGAAVFRIRTFALDHDIHVQQLTPPDGRIEDRVGMLRTHLDRTAGPVLAAVTLVSARDLSRQDLVAAGVVDGHLYVATEPTFAFWNPDGGQYRTRAAPIAPGERVGLCEVLYLGGIARFWLPESWQIEEDVDTGGCFYDPEGTGVLRLNVLTFATPGDGLPALPQSSRKPGERQIDGGVLPNDCGFDVYAFDTVDDDEALRIRCWQIAQPLPGQCRIFVFSYAYPIVDEDFLADEIALLDRELRRMIPYPTPV
ncbi:hypothetical protein ABZS66_41895 [Dactylosporangium sp. NPDC005572]|uniref:hypothetical protein n=1 Tax=Dactylosporangium sp. NPDC005572 TaxID=3156889 RepID=UPI0033AF8D08